MAGATAGAAPCGELSGIGFPGAAYEHGFFVADTERPARWCREN